MKRLAERHIPAREPNKPLLADNKALARGKPRLADRALVR